MQPTFGMLNTGAAFKGPFETIWNVEFKTILAKVITVIFVLSVQKREETKLTPIGANLIKIIKVFTIKF